ncbi:MAG: damage-inducible protein DinB [Spirochaetaceae bacterium]|jgi:uncharacterized damage-inducible protein DinB|nr:damage-inducible protein DinB [Spirochaetaceae bacterium]
MKELFITFAKFNKEADKTVYAILDGLSNEEREKDRGSYYKSLSGLFVHTLGGTVFLLGMMKDALGGSPALAALSALGSVTVPQGGLDAGQWKALGASFETADDAYIQFVSSLRESDFNAPVTLAWYKGNPPSVPVAFMLQQVTAHGTHHRGQISQILDSLKIDNDYSGISPAFVPKL